MRHRCQRQRSSESHTAGQACVPTANRLRQPRLQPLCQSQGKPGWRLRGIGLGRRAASDDEPRGKSQAKISRATARLTDAGRLREPSGGCASFDKDRSRHIEVSGARSARCHSSSGFAPPPALTYADRCADPQRDRYKSANRGWAQWQARSGFAPPSARRPCEAQNEAQARGPDPSRPRPGPRAAAARAARGRDRGDQGLQPRAARRDPGDGPGAPPAAV
jgi:hypothetical protein